VGQICKFSEEPTEQQKVMLMLLIIHSHICRQGFDRAQPGAPPFFPPFPEAEGRDQEAIRLRERRRPNT